MNVVATLEMTAFNALHMRLLTLVRNETIPFIAEKNKARILKLTASGSDYEGEIFHEYGSSQRKKREAAGLETSVKDLFFTGGMLGSLAFTPDDTLFGVEGFLTVGEEYQRIALGQQTGHSGSWGYEHKFMGVSEEGSQLAATEWNDHLGGLLRG